MYLDRFFDNNTFNHLVEQNNANYFALLNKCVINMCKNLHPIQSAILFPASSTSFMTIHKTFLVSRMHLHWT